LAAEACVGSFDHLIKGPHNIVFIEHFEQTLHRACRVATPQREVFAENVPNISQGAQNSILIRCKHGLDVSLAAIHIGRTGADVRSKQFVTNLPEGEDQRPAPLTAAAMPEVYRAPRFGVADSIGTTGVCGELPKDLLQGFNFAG
jgi:hypothetical protein